MFKSIPKSNISNRSFKVYKLWSEQTQEHAPLIKLYDVSGSYFDDSNPKSQGYYINSLYNSIKNKYYSTDGNAFTTFGSSQNLANHIRERDYQNNLIYAFSVQRSKFGEQIKPNSTTLTIGGVEYTDDEYGLLRTPVPSYTLVSLDLYSDNTDGGLLTISNGIDEYQIDVIDASMGTGIDLQSNLNNINLIYNGEADTLTVIKVDFTNGEIQFIEDFTWEGIQPQIHGNVFYDDGLVVLTTQQDPTLTNYDLEFRSTQTIYETEILVSADSGEFNYSQNPSAINVVVSGSYNFDTTAITNEKPAGTRKIREVLDISRTEEFSGSIGDSIGTWEDYYTKQSTDPTGSYLSTYITTIGLYDDDDNLLVVAKLPKPIKNLPDYNVNFLVRFDT
jgi:hypothetical protein